MSGDQDLKNAQEFLGVDDLADTREILDYWEQDMIETYAKNKLPPHTYLFEHVLIQYQKKRKADLDLLRELEKSFSTEGEPADEEHATVLIQVAFNKIVVPISSGTQMKKSELADMVSKNVDTLKESEQKAVIKYLRFLVKYWDTEAPLKDLLKKSPFYADLFGFKNIKTIQGYNEKRRNQMKRRLEFIVSYLSA